MKRFQFFLMTMVITFALAFNLFSQLQPFSTEWDATAFNNGRRVVRDCSMPNMGYYHFVWHSKAYPSQVVTPQAINCGNSDIYYACLDDNGTLVIPATNLTRQFKYADNRYPSIAIEYDGLDDFGDWRNFNDIHVVWQCKQTPGSSYEIFHAKILVGNPPAPPAALTGIKNLSNTPTDSMVPAIAINHYTYPFPETNQHIHVVWQEEDVNTGGVTPASEIYYTRSTTSGVIFIAAQNLTNTPRNSQMPSISCCLDTFFGFPLDYSGGDCDYSSNQVHVSYNEDTTAGGINIFYLGSTNDGSTWNWPINVTVFAQGTLQTMDGYSCIAVDMQDRVHITFMRDVLPNEPTAAYAPWLGPSTINAWPGPDPGMYNTIPNRIVYVSSSLFLQTAPVNKDQEFPTVALDREQSVTVNWQEYNASPLLPNEYEIIRIFNRNTAAPARPLQPPVYGPWSNFINDSADSANDDLFPNLAHKKVSMYMLINPSIPGFTEIWTKINGIGPTSATGPGFKNIMFLKNVQRDPNVN